MESTIDVVSLAVATAFVLLLSPCALAFGYWLATREWRGKWHDMAVWEEKHGREIEDERQRLWRHVKRLWDERDEAILDARDLIGLVDSARKSYWDLRLEWRDITRSLAQSRETARRLNRRCQYAESIAAKKSRRIEELAARCEELEKQLASPDDLQNYNSVPPNCTRYVTIKRFCREDEAVAEEGVGAVGRPICRCGNCGHQLTEVRPGKHQCDWCDGQGGTIDEIPHDHEMERQCLDAVDAGDETTLQDRIDELEQKGGDNAP
jgi:hypothetical protein